MYIIQILGFSTFNQDHEPIIIKKLFSGLPPGFQRIQILQISQKYTVSGKIPIKISIQRCSFGKDGTKLEARNIGLIIPPLLGKKLVTDGSPVY